MMHDTKGIPKSIHDQPTEHIVLCPPSEKCQNCGAVVDMAHGTLTFNRKTGVIFSCDMCPEWRLVTQGKLSSPE